MNGCQLTCALHLAIATGPVLFFGLQPRLKLIKFLVCYLVSLVENLLDSDHLRDVELEHILDSVLECHNTAGA